MGKRKGFNRGGPPAKAEVRLWVDGCAVPNPGRASCGVVMEHDGKRTETSFDLGHGTNNTAELQAIEMGLSLVPSPSLTVEVISDSQYALGVISGEYKAKANLEIVERIKSMVRGMNVSFRWVKGHAGNRNNNRADELANQELS